MEHAEKLNLRRPPRFYFRPPMPTVMFTTRFSPLLFLFLLAPGWLVGQEATLSGRVIDAETGEYILGATVILEGQPLGTSSNTYGFYSLTLPTGQRRLSWSFIGYMTETREVMLNGNQTLDVELKPNVIAVAAAEVEAERSAHTESTDMGKANVGVETIKSLPALLGEVDVLKVIQFLPGIQSAGEGNSGFYVRGGGPD